jgi:hypothetical protein
MPSVSYLTNSVAVTGIGTSYAANKAIALTSSTSTSGTQPAPGNDGYLGYLEIDADKASGSPASGTARLTWDAAGDVAASAEYSFTFLAGITTSSTRLGIGIPIDRWYRNPQASNAPLIVYLFLTVNNGTIDVAAGGARLHGHDSTTRV